jgi:Ala-tRNA(Pro) deacylase
MPNEEVKALLDNQHIAYRTILHPMTFTAQQTAQVTHIKGHEMAKTVVVRLDGRPVMVVVPAPYHVDLERLKEQTGAEEVELLDEQEFRNKFPGCEVGAMPPLGNLYGMPVYVEEELTADPEIAFNAGTHTEVIRMAYHDFEQLVHPRIGAFAV